MRSRETGFTLVELMVVVLVIGILVAVAVPVFNAAKDKAAWATCQTNQRTIIGAIEAWNAANGTRLDVSTASWTGGTDAYLSYKRDFPVSFLAGSDMWTSDEYVTGTYDRFGIPGDYPGKFPYKDQRLFPDYIKSIPRCPTGATPAMASIDWGRSSLFWTYCLKTDANGGYYFTGEVIDRNGSRQWSAGHSSLF